MYLPRNQRLALARFLLDSDDPSEDQETEALWHSEILKRAQGFVMSPKLILDFIQLPLFLAVSFFLFISNSFGQIVHVMPSGPIITPRYDESPTLDRRIDLNENGEFDLYFGRSGFHSLPDPETQSYYVTTTFLPEALGDLRFLNMDDAPTMAKVFEAGEWIGPDANWTEDPGLVMRRGESNNGLVSWGGSFYHTVGFFGFELELENEDILYGWIQLDGTDAEQSGLKVIDWAYNSSPGDGIEAGAIPEPSTVALFTGILGFAFVLVYKRRSRRR